MLTLYPYQEKTIADLCEPNKHICIAGTGSGKGAIMLHWLKATDKTKWLAVVTASKRDSKDVEHEAEGWFGADFMAGIELQVISWHGLAKWVMAHWAELDDWAFAFDEIHSARAGVSSNRGRAFIQVAKRTECWTGYTATPGDRWIDFQAYFVACGLVKNKTAFMREFCEIQTFKGFPEIVGYRSVKILDHYWRSIAVFPDTSAMLAELPEEQHKTVHFKPSAAYNKFKKDRRDENGEFVETVMGYCHRLRQLCFTKDKAQWLSDYLENLGTNTVLFYNYVIEGDEIEKIAKKVLPKGAKIWRIDGKHHDIPTEDKMGKYDIVLAQYTSGSASLNLQFLNEMVLVSPNYSYTVSVQARGRIKRIGQKKNMLFWYLLTDNTIENDVYRCLRGKSDFAETTWALAEVPELKLGEAHM